MAIKPNIDCYYRDEQGGRTYAYCPEYGAAVNACSRGDAEAALVRMVRAIAQEKHREYLSDEVCFTHHPTGATP